MFFVVVRNVELQAQTHAGGFEGTLPNAFDGENSIAGRLCARAVSFAMKDKWKADAALRPEAIDGLMARGNFCFVGRADRGDSKIEGVFVLSEGRDINAINALIETVERRFPGAICGFGDMQNEMEDSIASL